MVLVETTVLVTLPPEELLARSLRLLRSPGALGRLEVRADGSARLIGMLPGDEPDLDMALRTYRGATDFTWVERSRPDIVLRVGFAHLSGEDTWVTASLQLPEEYEAAFAEVSERMRELARDFQRVLEFGPVL